MYNFEERLEIEKELINQINLNAFELIKLKAEVDSAYEDLIYRFYHQSFKVYYLNEYTLKILTHLKMLMPNYELNKMFLNIIDLGVSKVFDRSVNENWTAETNPIVYAFYQAKYMLDMIVKHGIDHKLNEYGFLSAGWGSVLYLYNIR